MEMAVDPNERLLHQVLRTIPVTDRPIDEVQQPRLIAPHQLRKRQAVPLQKPGNQLVIRQISQRRLSLDPLRQRLCHITLWKSSFRPSGQALRHHPVQ